MPGKPGFVHFSAHTSLYEISTANKIFCTKTAQCVYAEYFAHPPFTQQRGEPVTFFVVWPPNRKSQHHARQSVKPLQKVRVTPGFMRFLRKQAGVQKKKQRISDLCTLVAFTPTSPSEPPREVERLKVIKTVAGLPDGDSSVLPGTLFYRCKKAHKQR